MCIRDRASTDPIPTADDFKEFFMVSANVITYQSITNLEPTTEYKVYCYAKSKYGIPSQTSIEATANTITTFAQEDGPVIVIGLSLIRIFMIKHSNS